MLIKTSRLLIKELEQSDAPFILQLVNSPGWLKYIGERNIKSKMEAVNYINIQQENYSNNLGLYGVALNEGGQLVGLCGFLKRDYLDNIDIGYALLPEYHSNGYALEAATIMIHKAFKTSMTKTIYAITKPSNNSSIKLLLKLGFRLLKEMAVRGELLTIFVLDKD